MKKEHSILGEENVGKLILKLSLPALVSQLVNLIYNMVDKMYIGHIEGEGLKALTGHGICLPIMILISAFSCLFGMGGAPKAAIEMGKGNDEEAERILGNVVTSIVITAFILTITLLTFGKDLLFFFGASEDTVVYAWDYLRIYLCGIIFVQITLGLNMFIMTQGYAKYSMITVIGSAILNIIIDPIFIFVLGMGIKGAALATIIAQAVSSMWIIFFLNSKKSKLRIKRKNLRLSSKIILPVMGLGAAPFVMQSTESILNICFNSSLQKYGGDIAVGTMTIVYSVFQLSIMVIQGFTQGTQPIISYNYGAGKMQRVKKAVSILVCICASFTTLICLLAEICPKAIISIFNNDAELISTASWVIKIYIFGFAIYGIQFACQQSFIAIGEAKISLFLAFLRKLILLIPLIYILPNFFENKMAGVFFAEPIADISATVITVVVFIIKVKGIFAIERDKEILISME